MHEFFRKAIDPKPRHRCLGLPLLPLTLGHLFLLHELDSPMLELGADSFGDILLAAYVCAQPHETARRWIRRGWWIEIFGRYWGWRCRKLSLAEEEQKLIRYLNDEQASAPTKPLNRDESRPINSPWAWVLLDFLRSTYRMSQEEALNMPVRVANCLWAVRADVEGRLELATSQTSVAAAIHRAWRAAHAEPVNGKEVE